MYLQYSATPSQQINTSNQLQDTTLQHTLVFGLVGF